MWYYICLVCPVRKKYQIVTESLQMLINNVFVTTILMFLYVWFSIEVKVALYVKHRPEAAVLSYAKGTFNKAVPAS